MKVFFYDIFFELISQTFAVIETLIVFLFQSFAKQMFVVVAEAAPVINVKRNDFINNRQMSWRYFYFILFSFDQNANSSKYDA